MAVSSFDFLSPSLFQLSFLVSILYYCLLLYSTLDSLLLLSATLLYTLRIPLSLSG